MKSVRCGSLFLWFRTFAGSLYFLSLMDEEMLITADSTDKLILYEGQVHVRDAALMLEEILYFYRPRGRVLSDEELKQVLVAYDEWVAQEAVPLEPDVLNAVNFLLNAGTRTGTGGGDDDESSGRTREVVDRGYFQQHKLVMMMHLGRLAKEISEAAKESADIYFSRAVVVGRNGRFSSCWSDIRCILDAEQEKLTSVDTGIMSGALRSLNNKQKLSVAARMELKKQKMNIVHIAHAAVPFHLFAQFVSQLLIDVTHQSDADEESVDEPYQQSVEEGEGTV